MDILQRFYKKVNEDFKPNSTVREGVTSDLGLLLDSMALEDSWSARKWYQKEIKACLYKLGITFENKQDNRLKVVMMKIERRIEHGK